MNELIDHRIREIQERDRIINQCRVAAGLKPIEPGEIKLVETKLVDTGLPIQTAGSPAEPGNK